jgi:hypothetical protein
MGVTNLTVCAHDAREGAHRLPVPVSGRCRRAYRPAFARGLRRVPGCAGRGQVPRCGAGDHSAGPVGEHE